MEWYLDVASATPVRSVWSVGSPMDGLVQISYDVLLNDSTLQLGSPAGDAGRGADGDDSLGVWGCCLHRSFCQSCIVTRVSTAGLVFLRSPLRVCYEESGRAVMSRVSEHMRSQYVLRSHFVHSSLHAPGRLPCRYLHLTLTFLRLLKVSQRALSGALDDRYDGDDHILNEYLQGRDHLSFHIHWHFIHWSKTQQIRECRVAHYWVLVRGGAARSGHLYVQCSFTTTVPAIRCFWNKKNSIERHFDGHDLRGLWWDLEQLDARVRHGRGLMPTVTT